MRNDKDNLIVKLHSIISILSKIISSSKIS